LFYKQNHIMLGLPPLNTEILYGGRNYIIVGINKTGTRVKGKYNDKIYLLPVEMTKLIWNSMKYPGLNKTPTSSGTLEIVNS
jgi:proline racemase